MGGKAEEKGLEEETHEDCAEESEEEDPGGYKGPVSTALIVQVCMWVEMGEEEEFCGVWLLWE